MTTKDATKRHLVHALSHHLLYQVGEALTAYAGILRATDRQFPDHEMRAVAGSCDQLARRVQEANNARDFIEDETRAVFLTEDEREYLAILVQEDGHRSALSAGVLAKLQE